MTLISKQLMLNIAETMVVIIVSALVYLILRLWMTRGLPTEKSKKRVGIRLFYFIVCIALIFIIKIWISGFTTVFYGLSLVSAALVITNKESVANLVGGVIIRWRGLFSEGDYIGIMEYRGIVRSIGLLYFKVLSADKENETVASGKTIQIPNGLVVNNVLTNFSVENNFILYHQSWLLASGHDLETCKRLLIETTQNVLIERYGTQYNLDKLKRGNPLIYKMIDLKVKVTTEMDFSRHPAAIRYRIHYYCRPADHVALDEQLRAAVLARCKSDNIDFAE